MEVRVIGIIMYMGWGKWKLRNGVGCRIVGFVIIVGESVGWEWLWDIGRDNGMGLRYEDRMKMVFVFVCEFSDVGLVFWCGGEGGGFVLCVEVGGDWFL